MIIKSYFNEQYFYLEDVYVIISKDESSSIVFKKIECEVLRSIDYDGFLSFFEKTFYSEKEYMKNYKYVGFRLIFNRFCVIFKNNEIYPRYPWDVSIVEGYLMRSRCKFDRVNFLSNSDEIEILRRRLYELERENKRLSDTIESLKDVIPKK